MSDKVNWDDFTPVEGAAQTSQAPVDWSQFEEVKPSGAIRKMADKALGFAGGAVGATKALTDVAGAGNKASSVLSTLNTGINDYLSPEAKADQQEQGRIIADANGKGVWEGVKAGARAFGVAPVQTAVQGLGSVVPIVVGTALAGGAAPAAAVGAGLGVAMGAGTAKGAIYDEIKKRGGTEEEAVRAQEYGGKNTDQIALGGALGTVDALTGVSKVASGMVRNALGKPVAQALTQGAERGIVGRAGMGVLKEMPLEAAQGGQEQVAANLAAQRAGYEAGTWDNVASNATLEALASVGPGAAFGVANGSPKKAIGEEPAQVESGGLALAPVGPAAPADPNGLEEFPGGMAATRKTFDPRDPDSRPPLAMMPVAEGIEYTPPPVIKPSVAMGLNPDAGPMSAAATIAVDTGAHQTQADEEASAADEAAYAEYIAQQDADAKQRDTIDKPITQGPLAEAAMSDDDKRAVLFSNQAVADGGIRHPGTQDGDILNGAGAPFTNYLSAGRRASMEGKDWTIAKIGEKQFVARRKDANVQDPAPATNEPTGAEATPDAQAQAVGANTNAAEPAPGTGTAKVEANGVAPKQGPGAPLANGFFAGPVEGEKFRVSDVSATGGLTLDKRLSGGTVSTMYVGADGGFVDAENVNMIGDGVARLWKPLTDLARQAAREILQEMGALPLGNKRREELKAKLKEVVANDGKPPAIKAPSTTADSDSGNEVSQSAQPGLPGEGAGVSQPTQPAPNKPPAFTRKLIPGMTDAELQQAVDYFGPDHKRTPKLIAAIEKRKVSQPQEKTSVTQADKAQPQQTQQQEAPAAGVSEPAAVATGAGEAEGVEAKPATLKDAIAKVRAKKAAESQRLAPAQALKLQEAHKAHGPDVTLGTVQKMYDRVMKSLITGKGSNGGVQYDIKPKERKELQAQADRLANDLSLFGVQQEQPAKDRKYNLIAVNEKTDEKTTLTKTPVPHAEAVTMKGKFDDKPGRRIQLEDAPTPDATKPVETTHAGLKIYPANVKVGDKVEQRWVAQSLNNAERERNGERQIGGDPMAETLDEAKQLAEQESASAKVLEQYRAEMAKIDDARKAESEIAQAKKDANKGKSIAERRKDAFLDGPTKLHPNAGLGTGTKRESMQKAVEQDRYIKSAMVRDEAAKKRDQEATERARRNNLPTGNINYPGVKEYFEAQARLKANKYEKPEYRVYMGRDGSDSFYEITKTEYDYAQELKSAPKDLRENYIKSAADSIGRLRKSDVDRVLNGLAKDNIDGVTRADLAAYIKEKHPDYTQEVDDVLAEIATATKSPADLVAGDRFKDANGAEFQVWSARQGRIEAHPVVDGKPVVNRDSVQRWATTDAVHGANPEYRTDIVVQHAAVHQDPGKAPEAATAPVIAQSLAKAARKEDHTQKEMRLWLVGEIDKAVKLTEDYADYQESIKKNGQDIADSIFFGKHSSSVGLTTPQGNGTITFDVPGDGKFKIRNSLRGLMEFRAKVEAKSGTGFTDKTTKAKGLPASTGVAKGSSNQIEALSSMLEELDFEAAVDYARETGTSLDSVKISPEVRKQFETYLKDGTEPQQFSPSRYWEYPGQDGADKDGNPIRKATLTKQIGASEYVALVVGTNATGFKYNITKDGKAVHAMLTSNSFANALKLAEDAINAIQPEVVKPKDTGWNMRGVGYAGKRYVGRNITLDDGREVVARIYENAGLYEDAEVKVDGKRVFAKTDRYKAEKLADDFIRTLTAKQVAAPEAVQTEAPAEPDIDLKGFSRAPKGNGEFDLIDGNLYVTVKPTATGFQANQGMSAKSGPRLTEQQAIEWAAALRDESKRIQAREAKPAEPAKTFRNPDTLNVLHAPIEDKDWFKLKNGEEWQARQGYSGRGWSLVRNGNLHPEARNFESQSDFIRSVIEVTGQTQAAGEVVAPVEANDEPIPAVSEAQARKQMEWRNMGQKDGTKSHLLFFFESEKDKGTGAAMNRGEVSLYPGASGWKVEDGDGTSYKSLADAKKAAIDLAIPKLQDQGYILKPAQAATAILDAANVTGKERIDALKDVKKGDITPEELQAAYPAKEDGEKTEPWKMTRAEAAKSFPGDEYDKMLNRSAVLGDITYEEAGKRSRINVTGNKEFWAKTRKDLLQDKKDAVKFARGDRAEVNKLKPTEGFAAWRIKSMSATGKSAIEAAGKYHDELLSVHKERVQEALDEGKDVPLEVLADYPDLSKPAAQEPAKTAQTPISDFGQKIGGAKKDTWTGFKDDLGAVSDDEIAGRKLSEIWPNPDYQKMIDDGMDAKSVAVIRALRDEIPAKPRSPYKVKRWAEQVKTMRDLAANIMDGKDTGAAVVAQLDRGSSQMRGIAGRVDLYMAVGHDKSLEGIRLSKHHYSLYRGRENVTLWVAERDAGATAFSNWPQELATGDTKEQAIEAFKEKYDSLDATAAVKKAEFVIFTKGGGDKGFYIGKKIGRNIADMGGPFDSLKDARAYREKNLPELEAKLAKYKEIPKERRDTNEPRVGEDMRNGQDVTPEMFAEAFGFKGVEFGNYVEQKRRQKDLNESFDALMDMAAIMGVPAKAISLNGELGLAFGARGSGGVNPAAAHYESDKIVINLTKREGAGSLGHEWWHALDNYFSRMRGSRTSPYMTTATDVDLSARGSNYVAYPGVRKEMIDAFGEVVRSIRLTAIKARSSKMDAKRTKEYWTTGEEMAARAFESYLISKLHDQNASNDYLANVVDQKTWDAMAALGMENEDSYPYPTAGEMPLIRTGFDKFFQTLETKETESGNVAMFSRPRFSRGAQSQANESVERLATGIASHWDNAPKIVVAFDMNDPVVPDSARRADLKQRSGGARGAPEGFYYQGKVYLMASRLKTPSDAARVLFHEALGHHGLRGAFGGSLKPILNQVATMRKAEVDAKIKEYGLRGVSNLDRLTAAEEVLAEMAQTTPGIGFVTRAIAAIRTWLRTNVPGFKNLALSDAEIIANYILPARAWVENGGNNGGPRGGLPAMTRSESLKDYSTEPFYSALAREVGGLNANAMAAPGWMMNIHGLVKNGKVKADELEWSGLNEWLNLQEGKVTKAAVLDYLAANGVKVQESVLGDGTGWSVVDQDTGGDRHHESFATEREANARATELGDNRFGVISDANAPGAETKYAKYQLPGGENYREVLLTLPEKKEVWRIREQGGKWEVYSDRTSLGSFVDKARAEDEAAYNNRTASPVSGYKSSHWDQKNVLAHIRVNDRTDADGKRVLFVEEIQSDWGQAGKKEGFAGAITPDSPMKAEYKDGYWEVRTTAGEFITNVTPTDYLGDDSFGTPRYREITEQEAIEATRKRLRSNPQYTSQAHVVPRAPFVDKTDKWLTLTLKRIVKLAVDGGYDKVAFVDGEQSAARYDLSKHISQIVVTRGIGIGFAITARDNSNKVVMSEERVDLTGLDELIGKDLSEKIKDDFAEKPGNSHSYSGLDLKVGGEGMKTFYGAIVPNATKALLRKLGGGQMELVTIGTPFQEPGSVDRDGTVIGPNGVRGTMTDQPGFTITTAMRDKAAGGLPMFSRATTARDLTQSFGNAVKNITVTDLKRRAGFKATDYLGLGLQTLGRRQLVDLYGNDLPLENYSQLVAQMEADKNDGGATADALAQDWGKLKDEQVLSELMHDATLQQIDPDKPLVDGDAPLIHAGLKSRFDGLSNDAKKVYRDARDSYVTHNESVRQEIKARIERSEIKGERKAALLKQMDDEFFKNVKGVYFPLARFGQYVVVTRGADGMVDNVSRAETMGEADELRRAMLKAYPKENGYDVGKVILSKDFVAGRDAVGRGFMTDLYQALDKQDMDAKQRAELEDTLGQLYLSSLPDLSWAKHGIHRKGTPGFSQDARRAFSQNMFHGARYLAKLRYSDLMQDELNFMQKHVDEVLNVLPDEDGFDGRTAQRVVDEFNKRHESLMNPQSSPLSTALTSLGFVFHLGLSPASAMVNLSQTALVAYPIMAAKWGYAKTAAALMTASQQAAKGRNDISASLNEDEKRAYDEAVKAGTIDVTMAHDLAGIAQGEDAGVMWKVRPVMRWASFMFHHAEKFNRQVTFVASYRLAREAGANHKTAFEQATKATYDGHFDYSSANRPRIMQGNVARVLLLFKQYGQNMVYTLSRNAYLAAKGDKQALKTISGLLVSHGLSAGMLGLPMVTTLMAAASMMGGGEDDPWDAKVALQNLLADSLGQKPAEVLMHGLSRATPWDISGRVGLDRLILPDVQEGLEGQRLAESVAFAALGPAAGIGLNVLRGAQEIGQGHVQRGIETMMPAALRGPMKSLRYANEGAQDKTGVSIVDDVNPAGVAGQFFGFSPSDVRNATEGKSAIMDLDRRLGERRSGLMRQYAMAMMAGDQDGARDVRDSITAFNEKNPTRRINPMQLAQSLRMRQKRIDQADGGVSLPKGRRDAIEAGRFAVVD